MTTLRRDDFYYELPERLIAQTPLAHRDESRLLCLDKATGAIDHRTFSDIRGMLRQGDCLVLNETKVLPARLFGRKETGAKVEVLLLKRLPDAHWECLVKPGKRMKTGDFVRFSDRLSATVTEVTETGNRIVRFDVDGIFEEILDELGEMPLPPYIHEKLDDKERYQTVYAQNTGSAAAPTAGLHFTEQLLEAIRADGVSIAKVTLHVGLGTFRPVSAERIQDHTMHSEAYAMSAETAAMLNDCRQRGGRIVCVGTTSVRVVESCAKDGVAYAGSGDTDIFIYPGYTFQMVDALVTNFHLPESTLLMLISALAGKDRVFRAYEEAIAREYRFFSFGDAMFLS